MALERSEDAPAPSGSLARGLAIVRALVAAPQPMTLTDIVAEVAIDQSTVLRLLRTLEEEGFVLRAGRHYMASPDAFLPLPLMHPLAELRREARPLLERLADDLRATAVLVLFQGDERFVVDVARGANAPMPYYSIWLEGPEQTNGSGKIMLLARDEAERRRLLGPEPYRAFTAATLTDYAAVAAELADAAARGFAWGRDEYRDGLSSIAAPVAGADGGAGGCIVANALSADWDEAACLKVGRALLAAARLLPLQAPSLRAALRFLGAR